MLGRETRRCVFVALWLQAIASTLPRCVCCRVPASRDGHSHGKPSRCLQARQPRASGPAPPGRADGHDRVRHERGHEGGREGGREGGDVDERFVRICWSTCAQRLARPLRALWKETASTRHQRRAQWERWLPFAGAAGCVAVAERTWPPPVVNAHGRRICLTT